MTSKEALERLYLSLYSTNEMANYYDLVLKDLERLEELKNAKRKQVVCRTYPKNYTNNLSALQNYLNDGYYVVMCNHISGGGCENLEYILEKEVLGNDR